MKTKFWKLFVLCIFFVQVIYGQNTPPIELNLQAGQSYSQAVGGIMQTLNTERIPYGVLYERVVGWANLTEWYSGDTTNFSHIKQAWWDLENCKTVPGNSFESLKQEIAIAQSDDKIALIGIGFGFAYIDSLALQDGRIRIEDNQLIDTGGATPYISKRIHLAALSNEKPAANTAYQIHTGIPFILDNLSDEIVSGYTIQNLSNGQYYTLPAHGATPISFSLEGINTLKITISTNKGDYDAIQNIMVLPPFRPMRDSGTGNDPENKLLTSVIPFKGYDETDASISHADYHIYYHFAPNNPSQSERVLKKPIVILDGFDPLDQRNYAQIYDSMLLYDNKSKRLGDELRLKGYDVVILNFPITGSTKEETKKNGNICIPLVNGIRRDGGTDYIERNAYLLVRLIQELNAELRRNGSTEKLIVVGPSMAALISRYALAYMEKEEAAGTPNMNHNTRLWVSFDGPHLGANIPLALQKTMYFFGFTGGQQSARDAYEKLLHSVAARQMLIEQLNGYGYAATGNGLNGTDFFFTKCNNNIRNNGLPNSGGWPQNLRKVTLINGSGGGMMTHAPSDEFLSLDAYKKFIFNIKIAEIKNHFLPQTGITDRYFKGKVTTRGFLSIAFTTEENYVENNNRRGSMDVAPGGTFDAQAIIKDQFSQALNSIKIKKQTWTIKNNHCFIPTISALAFKNADFQWNMPVNNRDLVQTGEIPFDNYFLSSYNQEHVLLTQESVAWLMDQLDGIYYNNFGKMKISGPSVICDQATYTIENLPPEATVQWSASNNNLQLISGQGTDTALFRKTANGKVMITAKIELNGTEIDLESKWITTETKVSISGKWMIGCGKTGLWHASLSCMPSDPEENIEYEWTLENGKDYYHNSGPNFAIRTECGNNRTSLDPRQPIDAPHDNYTLHVNVRYPDGYNISSSRQIEIFGYIEMFERSQLQSQSRSRSQSFTLSPNPASDTVTLTFTESDGEEQERASNTTGSGFESAAYQIQLWSMGGMLLKQHKSNLRSFQIHIGDLPKGIYMVHVIRNGERCTKKLIKE